MITGSALNFAGAATGIGIFGAEAVLRYLVPGAIVSIIITCAYIFINIPRGNNGAVSAFALVKSFILTILSVPGSLVSVIGKLFSHKKSNLMKKKEALPGAACQIDRLRCFWGFSAKKTPVQPGVGKNTLVNGRKNLLC